MKTKDTKNFIALDLGASSGRAVLGKFQKQALEIEEIHRFENIPVEIQGTLYWDAPMLFREICNGIRLGFERAGENISGIGIDTWGVDFGLLDKNGRLIGNPVHYRDTRTNGIMEKVFEIIPREKIFETTGIQFMQLNTLFQLAAMKFGKWSELERAETLLMMPDLFNYFLCGKKSAEFTEATTTQFYDINRKNWAFAILTELGIPTGILPKIIQPGSVLGILDRAILAKNGLAVPVIAPACHDTGSAVAAVPSSSEDKPGTWAYLSSGTWSLLGIEIKNPIVNELALKFNFTNEGGVSGTFRFLKNIAGLWFIQECRRIWSLEEKREISFQELIKQAKSAKPFQYFIDPDHPCFLKPANMPKAIAEFCKNTGQTVPEDRGEIVRCVLESLALKYQMIREQMEMVSGAKIEKLHIVGGGSKNHLLNQFTANALGVPVLAGPSEATAIGNIILQAMALKIIPDIKTGRNIIRKSFPLKIFEPKNISQWQDASLKFAKIISQNP